MSEPRGSSSSLPHLRAIMGKYRATRLPRGCSASWRISTTLDRHQDLLQCPLPNHHTQTLNKTYRIHRQTQLTFSTPQARPLPPKASSSTGGNLTTFIASITHFMLPLIYPRPFLSGQRRIPQPCRGHGILVRMDSLINPGLPRSMSTMDGE